MFFSPGRRSVKLTTVIVTVLSVQCLLFNRRVFGDVDSRTSYASAIRDGHVVDKKFDESIVIVGPGDVPYRTNRAELALNRLFRGHGQPAKRRDKREASVFRNYAPDAEISPSSNCQLSLKDNGTRPNCAAKKQMIKTSPSSSLKGGLMSTTVLPSPAAVMKSVTRDRPKKSAERSRMEKRKRRSVKDETADGRGEKEEDEDDEEDLISRSVMAVGKSIMKASKKMNKMAMSKPGMFMLGMAQANLHNFVMQSLMMSKMTLISMVMMFIREVVFGEKANQVKYYNFGYENPPHPEYSHHHSAQRRVIRW